MLSMFSSICGIALRDLPDEQFKVGSAGLVIAIVGGALMPKLQVIDTGSRRGRHNSFSSFRG